MPSPTDLYLDLLKKALTRVAFEDESIVPEDRHRRRWHRGRRPLDRERRAEGRDWPVHAETMVGLARLDQLQRAVESVLADDVPGGHRTPTTSEVPPSPPS